MEALEWQKLLNGLNDVDVLRWVLGCLDTHHHPDEGQFLTTTVPPTFSLAGACGRKAERAKLLGNLLKA